MALVLLFLNCVESKKKTNFVHFCSHLFKVSITIIILFSSKTIVVFMQYILYFTIKIIKNYLKVYKFFFCKYILNQAYMLC